MARKRNSRKRLTPLQSEYRKQQRRLQNAVRRYERQGYIFTENPIPETPKRVTRKALERLQATKAQTLLESAVALDTGTGEITPALSVQAERRRESARKAAQTRRLKRQEVEEVKSLPDFDNIIIGTFRADISNFPEVAAPLLNQWLDGLLTQYSKGDVAQMLEDGRANGVMIDYTVAYRRDLLLNYITDMLEYLPGASIGFKQEIVEALEYSEDWEQPE